MGATLALATGCAVGEVRVKSLDSAVALDGQLLSTDVSVKTDASGGGGGGATDAGPSVVDVTVGSVDVTALDGADSAATDSGAADSGAADTKAVADAQPSVDSARPDSGAPDSTVTADSTADSTVDAGPSGDSTHDSAGGGGDATIDTLVDTRHDSGGDGTVDTSVDSAIDSGGSVVPGAPCPCAIGLVCIYGQCRSTCEAPSGTCNVTSVCPANEACVPTTHGEHVCMPAVNVGAACSGSVFCPNGSVCGTYAGQALCRRTCANPGLPCAGGGSCVAVNGSCAFCL
ncbi:MAG: hypothetical protein KC503_27100 [Myxococcales bacterium]|nr:hypothetical protein [Myxococcales bacterium]